MGLCCSFVLFVILITYTGYKLSVMERKKSVDIVQAVVEDHYDSSHVIRAENGFNLAAAVFNPFETSADK